jgi:CubicO group peptidase (beta-lactamase class C family)
VVRVLLFWSVLTASAYGEPLAFIDANTEPGCAIAAIRGGRVVQRSVRGLANLEHHVPLTDSTVFYIGSMSKQFTAMSIGLLAEDGKLTVEDDIRKWLPEMPSYAAPIRIRHLLHHTSGLRDFGDLFALAGVNDPDWIAAESVLELIARQRGLVFPTGTQNQYSNTGYFLLGLIVQRASGKPLPQLAQERIFGPLGMTHTSYVADQARVIPGRADSYEKTPAGWRHVFTAQEHIGEGGVFTTLDDLARWDANFDSPTVGKKSAIKLLTTAGTLDDGRPIQFHFAVGTGGYGGGLVLGSSLGHAAQFHSGSWLAYRSYMARFPNDGLTLVSLCNRRDRDPWSLVEPMARTLLPASTQAAPAPLAPVRRLDSHRLAKLAGTYANESTWRRFEVVDGQLMSMPNRDPFDAVDESTFRARAEPESLLHFLPDGHVKMTSPDAAAILLDRVVLSKPPVPADYAGEYVSTEIGHTSFVERQRSLWTRRGAIEPWEPLPAIADDLFVIANEALVRFHRNRERRVVGFTISLPHLPGIEYQRADMLR